MSVADRRRQRAFCLVAVAAVLAVVATLLVPPGWRARAVAWVGHAVWSWYRPVHTPPTDAWLASGAPPIAHALGAVRGEAYTNSREAFEESYRAGARVFEVDLAFTRDDSLVATHRWHEPRVLPREERPTAAEFRRAGLSSGLSSLDAASVLALLAAHPDAWLVLDPKDDLDASLAQLVAVARRTDPAVLDRVIPQLYRERDLGIAARVHPWRGYIYTLYRVRPTPAQLARFVRRNGLHVVTMPAEWVAERYTAPVREAGAVVYAHTVNDPAEAARLRALGAAGIYTDSLFRQNGR